jgi:hypothetical protein
VEDQGPPTPLSFYRSPSRTLPQRPTPFVALSMQSDTFRSDGRPACRDRRIYRDAVHKG